MKMNKFFTFFLIAVCFMLTYIYIPIVSALEPPTKEQLAQYRKDGSLQHRIAAAKRLGNHRVSPDIAQRTTFKLRQLALQAKGYTVNELKTLPAPPSGWQGLPTRGDDRIFAILIEFSDYQHITEDTTAAVQSRLFGEGDGGYPYESLRNFYIRSSYDQLHLSGNTFGWFQTGYPRSEVPETYTGIENLIKTAIQYYDAQGHDFSQYDNDDDGDIDYFIVIWTGPHGGWASFWWGYQTYFYDYNFKVDGKRLSKYSWQWESYNYPSGHYTAQVVIHETGHALGLPDYYDYDSSVGPDGGIGGLDQMAGNWGDHNCFSKFMLDWITPTTINSGTFYSILQASGTSKDALLVMPNASEGDIFNEYYMIQNRTRVAEGNDIDFPNDGLLIWHVDAVLNAMGTDFKYDNSYTSRKLLRLMEADGLEEIETHNAYADAGDYYNSGNVLSPYTLPNSNAYNGNSTTITVTSISAPEQTMSCIVSLLDGLNPVYRFWSDKFQNHFYTISNDEKNFIQSTYPDDVWHFETLSMYAFQKQIVGSKPVYRFWSDKYQSHFYTISETEKNFLLTNYSQNIWKYEGVAWFAFDEWNNGTFPVYRFWNPNNNAHFYTANETEKDFIQTNYPETIWKYEGIAWYAFQP